MVACSFLCEGGHFSMFPTVSARVFGIRSGGLIGAFVMFAVPVASTTSFIIENYYGDDIPHWAIFACSAVLTVINIALLYFFDDRPILTAKEINN